MHTYACICAVLKYYLLCTIENHLKNQFNLRINESYEAGESRARSLLQTQKLRTI